MKEARVLVVDDSAAMRALFCDILDQAKNVEVIGTASNADDARDKIAELRPNVVTLDVEMPGMSGIEFLQEIMEENPLPVVMLSSITQSGTGTAQKAMELGAVDCFPKPLKATPEVFAESVSKLGQIVVDAANGKSSAAQESAGQASHEDYQPGDKVVVLAGGESSLDALRQLLSAMPSNCPPTLVVLDCDKAEANAFIHKASTYAACTVMLAKADEMMFPGTVYLAPSSHEHVLIEDAAGPLIRTVDRDPVGGFRPSADLLFGSLARSGLPCVAGLLEGDGADGVRGVKMLSDKGCDVALQDVSIGGKRERVDAAKTQVPAAQSFTVAELAGKLLALTAAA